MAVLKDFRKKTSLRSFNPLRAALDKRCLVGNNVFVSSREESLIAFGLFFACSCGRSRSGFKARDPMVYPGKPEGSGYTGGLFCNPCFEPRGVIWYSDRKSTRLNSSHVRI